jgi:hypothetical protein
MTRKFFITGAALIALTAAAVTLAFTGSGHTTSKAEAERGSASALAGRQKLAQEALRAHPFTRRSAQLPSSARIRTRVHVGQATIDPPAPKTRDHDADIEENSNPTSTKQLLYHGGAVQTSPHIYLVFWGPTWFSGGDPYGAANRLHYFVSGVSGSGWANVMKQYGSNYGSFSNPTGQYKGWIKDSTAVPTHPTTTDIANAVKRAAALTGDRSYNAQYIIAMPWGVFDQYSMSASACAWHYYTYVNSTQWVTYTALPYTPYVDKAYGYGCGTGKVNGTNGILDGITINAGHEYAETVNDPSVNAWSDTDHSENADKCSWKNLANRPFANGMSFAVQPTWSNYYRTQYGNGCLYSS